MVILAQAVRVDRGAATLVVVLLAGVLHAVVTAAVATAAHGGPPVLDALRHGLFETLFTVVLSPAMLAFVAWQERLLGVEP